MESGAGEGGGACFVRARAYCVTRRFVVDWYLGIADLLSCMLVL